MDRLLLQGCHKHYSLCNLNAAVDCYSLCKQTINMT
uniref:Uncharacterized protein n=1 Tax=Setaria italica TaxID=4555 RepID=K3XTY5_SETIT